MFAFQVFHAPLLQELENGRSHGPDGNVGHQRQILHQTDGLTFWRFGGTNLEKMKLESK
jgi:hypothetical protein